jgi:sigma-E factor negative regulatory protein RseA
MSEERDSQLSAMFDGELPQAECELLARRLTRESATAVGGQVRVLSVADRVAQRMGAVAALANGSESGADLSENRFQMRDRIRRWGQPLAGVGVAAGVAALSIFWLQSRVTDNALALSAQLAASQADANNGEVVLGGNELPDLRQQLGSNLSLVTVGGAVTAQASRPNQRSNNRALASNGEPERYTVPTPGRDQGAAFAAAQFANYVVAHSEYAAPLNRRSVLSALVAGESSHPVPVDATEPRPAPQSGPEIR